MNKKYLVILAVVAVLSAIGIILISSHNVSAYENLENFDSDIKLYKSSTCGCCEIYSSYFKSKGNKNLEIIDVPDIKSVIEQYEIPEFLESCHTVIIGDYFVEGHVPLEAIEKLLSENPDIEGIGMPGMPAGSPGMPGTKQGDFVVYGINYDKSSFEFMRI